MRWKQMLGLALFTAVLVTSIPTMGGTVRKAPDNLVPDEPISSSVNYVSTWNIQDWVAWHESDTKSDNDIKRIKRDDVDEKHLFDEERGWVTTTYPKTRSDMLFLLDDGWELPYGTEKNGHNAQYFGCQVLPEEKFPPAEWGDTPQERLKTLNDKIKAEGWKGTGLLIIAQRSTAYPEYAGKDDEEFWRMRLRWSKYAGIDYWKIDWGNDQKKIDWRRKISEWAKEEYPELIIEHILGGRGKNINNERVEEDLLLDNIQLAAFSDSYRTYDVLDNLAAAITLDRVGEQLIAGYTEEGTAMGMMNAEDEMYICGSLGLAFGVMRFPPTVAVDSEKSGSNYYGIGVEKGNYMAGGIKFARTKATRNRLDEVDRTVYWERIAPPYTVGDYDTALSNAYLRDDWTFDTDSVENPRAWDGTSGALYQKAPAAIARGIDLPTVTVADGDEIPFLTASRNPNGAIGIAAYARTHFNTGGYIPVKSAQVSLNAGDLTGKIGIFGYYGSLSLTFNQDLSGKNVYAQDLLAKEAEDITRDVTINGNTITLDGKLLEEIGLSAATPGDTSDPGLVLQIGEEEDFLPAPETNARPKRWDVNNASFEKFHYDANSGQSIKSVTAAGWRRWNNTDAAYLTQGGHTGDYAGIHTSDRDYEVSTYQVNKSVANGVYKASCYVKSSGFSRKSGSHDTSAGFYVLNTGASSQYVDIQEMGKLDDWTYIEIPAFDVTNGQIQVEFYTYGAAGESLLFDDVKVEYVGDFPDEIEEDPILEFDFSKYQTENGTTTVTGVAGDKEVTAVANGIAFEEDEEENSVAVYPMDGNRLTTGITFAPGEDDPMKTLTKGKGVTISMWVKSDRDGVNNTLFAYGARQDGGSGDLGASLQMKENEVYYRNAGGQSGGQKVEGLPNPYKKDNWQLFTFVESADGTNGTFYVDGVQLGTCSGDKTLLGFATDENTPDIYYFGFLPYQSGTDEHFVGAIDSIAVYDLALTDRQVQRLYKNRFAPKENPRVKEVEEFINSYLATCDDVALYSRVVEARDKYEELSEEEKAMVSESAYKLLLSAEDYMQGFLDRKDEVAKAIEKLGEITLDKKADVQKLLADYEKLPNNMKELIPPETLKKLTDAEAKIAALEQGTGSSIPVGTITEGLSAETGLGYYQVIDVKNRTAKLVSVKNKKATKLNVPATVVINGVTCNVAEVGANVMKGNSRLTKVVLGKNIVTIGKNAFSGCKKLKTVQLKGKTLKTIGNGAFKKTSAKLSVKASKLTKKQKTKLEKLIRSKGNKKAVVK